MSRKEKKAREQKLSTRQLINTKAVSDYSLETYDGDDLVYFMIRPTNLSVLSDSSVGGQGVCADECAERRGGDRDAVLKQQGELRGEQKFFAEAGRGGEEPGGPQAPGT